VRGSARGLSVMHPWSSVDEVEMLSQAVDSAVEERASQQYQRRRSVVLSPLHWAGSSCDWLPLLPFVT